MSRAVCDSNTGGASMKLTGKRCMENMSVSSCSKVTRVGHSNKVGERRVAESNTQRWRAKKPAVVAISISDTEVGTMTKSNSNINSAAMASLQVRSHTTTSLLLAARRRCKRASKIGRLPPLSSGRCSCKTTTPTCGACFNQVLEEPCESQSIRVVSKAMRRRKNAAKLAETVLLPTPPFWLVTKILYAMSINLFVANCPRSHKCFKSITCG